MYDIQCPYCEAVQLPGESMLGRLGQLIYFRCRYCGGDFSQHVSNVLEDESDPDYYPETD